MLQHFLILLAVNFVLIFVSFLISFALNIKRGVIILISVFIIYISLIVALLTGLGAADLISAKNYIYVIGFFVVLILLLCRKYIKNFVFLATDIKNWFICLSMHKKIFLLFLLPIIYFFSLWLWRLAYTPIWDYDSIAYHMPFVADFLQRGSINHIYFPALSGPIDYYPANMELIFVHILLFFNYDSFLSVLNLLLVVPLMLAIYLSAKELNASKRLAIFCAFAFVTMPVFLRMIGTLKIDIFFSMLFVCATLFLIRYTKQRNISDLVLFSASAGLFFGSRYLAIPYLILPLVFLFAILIYQFIFLNKKRVILHLAVFLLIFAALGGYWYARNYLATKNPIFPKQVTLGKNIIFQGMAGGFSEELAPTSILSNINSKQNIFKISGDFVGETGLSIFFIINFMLVLLAVFWTGWRAAIWTESRIYPKKPNILDLFKKFFPFLVFLIAIPFYIYFYISSPNTFLHILQNIRYVLPGLFLGLLMIVFVASWPSSQSSIASGDLRKNDIFGNLAILCFAIIIIFNLAFFYIFSEPQMTLGATPQCNLASRDALYLKLKETYNGFWPVLDAMEWLDKNISSDAKIGYSGFHFHYPLFGQKLSRRVDYITVGKCHDCNYFDFKNEGGNIFSNPDFDAWLSNIRYYDNDYYVYFNQMNSPDYEKIWLKENPELFQFIYGLDGAYIYKIIKQ